MEVVYAFIRVLENKALQLYDLIINGWNQIPQNYIQMVMEKKKDRNMRVNSTQK